MTSAQEMLVIITTVSITSPRLLLEVGEGELGHSWTLVKPLQPLAPALGWK